jgi:hypothetical protein
LCVMLPVPITSTPSLRSPPKACPSAKKIGRKWSSVGCARCACGASSR